MDLALSRLSSFGLPIIAADADRAVRSSLIKLRLIKLKREIPYVDAFESNWRATREITFL